MVTLKRNLRRLLSACSTDNAASASARGIEAFEEPARVRSSAPMRGARALGRACRLTDWADVLVGGARAVLHHVAGAG